LAGKKNLSTVWLQIQPLTQLNYTSRFGLIFESCQNCRQIIGTPCRSIFHAARSSQMPYTAEILKINGFNHTIKNALELRLDRVMLFGCIVTRNVAQRQIRKLATQDRIGKQCVHTQTCKTKLIVTRAYSEPVVKGYSAKQVTRARI
jgi:hypothetical protein